MIAKTKISTALYNEYPTQLTKLGTVVAWSRKGDIVLALEAIDRIRGHFVPVLWNDQVVFVYDDDLAPVEEESRSL